MSGKAPGTLGDDEQRLLMAKVTQLLRAAYGHEAHTAIVVAKHIVTATGEGVALYTMGTLASVEDMRELLVMAVERLSREGSQMRSLVIEDESGAMQ